MLRISEVETANGRVVLRLEGRVVGAWVQELERASRKFLESGQSVELDLAEVSYVDRDGVALLRRLKRGEGLAHY